MFGIGVDFVEDEEDEDDDNGGQYGVAGAVHSGLTTRGLKAYSFQRNMQGLCLLVWGLKLCRFKL